MDSKMNPAMRAADRFRHSRQLHGYARGKIAWDPAYAWLAGELRGGSLPLLDIGCGAGILGAYLRECGCGRPLTGIDPDANKIGIAQGVAAAYKDLFFVTGDARNLPEFSGEIIMLDVLHYMSSDDQASVLANVVARLAPGGRAFVRTTFRDSSWRYHVTLLEEFFVRWSGWIRGGRCCFPTREEVLGPLLGAGCEVEIFPLWGRTPFNSHMIVARRS